MKVLRVVRRRNIRIEKRCAAKVRKVTHCGFPRHCHGA